MTQPDLDFTNSEVVRPSVYSEHAFELGVEAQRIDGSRAKVLARLQRGEATNIELNRICYRYGARILELRRAGYPITTEPAGRGVWLYRLTGGAA